MTHSTSGVLAPKLTLMPKVDRGDKITIEVEILSAWADGTVTFSLFGHPGLTTIPCDSPQIVGIEKAKASKTPRKRANA